MESLMKQKGLHERRDMNRQHVQGKPCEKESYQRPGVASKGINGYTRITSKHYKQPDLSKTISRELDKTTKDLCKWRRSILLERHMSNANRERAAKEAGDEMRRYIETANLEKERCKAWMIVEEEETMKAEAAASQKESAQRGLVFLGSQIQTIESFGDKRTCSKYAKEFKAYSDLLADAVKEEQQARKNLVIVQEEKEATYKAAREAIKMARAAREKKLSILRPNSTNKENSLAVNK